MNFIPQHKNTKKSNSPLLKQIIDFIPKHVFYGAIHKFQSDKGCSKYKTYYQFVSLITNNLKWSAAKIPTFFKHRWQIETFFKLIKHDSFKTFAIQKY